MGLKGNMWRVIKKMYEVQYFSGREVCVCVAQGCSLSPINDLLKEVEQAKLGVQLIVVRRLEECYSLTIL